MDFITNRGIKIPILGFGTYKIGDYISNEKKELETLEYGYKYYDISLLDTAEMYGNGKSEKLISKFISLHNRKELFIIDKILPENIENGKYLEACQNSLQRLKIKQIDLYLLHWRGNVDLSVFVKNMEHLVALGLIKHWGVSNFDVSDMEDLFKIKGGDKCFLNQCLYNLTARGVEYDLIPWCKAHNVTFMAYSPIGHNEKYKKALKENKELVDLAIKNKESIESLLLRFALRNKDIVVAFKTSNIEHLITNMDKAFLPLSKDEICVMEKIYPAPKEKTKLQKI